MIYLKTYESWDRWDNPKVVIPESLEDRCKMFIDRENESGIKYTISGDFVNVNSNISLKLYDMDSIPIKFGVVEGNMFINGDILTLDNSPERVRTMNIIGCKNLQSLVGGPKFVRNWYHLPGNLESLDGLARPWGGESYTLSFPKYFMDSKLAYVLELFVNKKFDNEFEITNKVCDDIDLFNDYDPLDGDTLILDRMNQFLESLFPQAQARNIHLTKSNIESLKSNGVKVI